MSIHSTLTESAIAQSELNTGGKSILKKSTSTKLEICTSDPEGIRAAVEGGAYRVELCSGLAEGGLTPSVSLIRFCTKQIPTNVLIRPRGGDFIYTKDELDVMEEDILVATRAGAKGVVTGALTPNGEVDKEACRRLLQHAKGLDNTFHRAFDMTSDPFKALEDIISLGFNRILTSGQARTALEGSAMISKLKEQAAGRIIIMAGAGVTPSNAYQIVANSGADEIHASARSRVMSSMKSNGEASMGCAEEPDGSRMATDASIVAQIKKALN